MEKKILFPQVGGFLHGGDYNPEQWPEEIWEEEQRFVNPHVHYLDMTPEYYRMKNALLRKAKES